MPRTTEDIVKEIIGQQAVTIAALQALVEALQAELAAQKAKEA